MALLAMYELQGSTLDWWTRDQRLRQIIAIDPSNGGAMSDLSSHPFSPLQTFADSPGVGKL